MTERWLPVCGWEDFYMVSDQGRVMRRARSVTRHDMTLRYREKILKPSGNQAGYQRVCFCVLGLGQRVVLVHHLVMAAFVGPRPAGSDIRHLDGDPANNRLGNLAYGTKSENMFDAIAHGRRPDLRGARNPWARLDDEAVRAMRLRREAGRTIASIASEFGVSTSSAFRIVKRMSWRHVV